MFLINENLSANEIRTEINQILKPIKSFCKKWDVEVQYDGKIVTVLIRMQNAYDL